MSEMIERVAKAICRTVPIDGSQWVDGFGHNFPEEYSEREQALIRSLARTAIEAMREPTKEMIVAGNDKIDECIDFRNYDSDTGYEVGAEASFSAVNAMIDAALADTPIPGER